MSRKLMLTALVLLPGMAFALEFGEVSARVAEVESVWLAERAVLLAEQELRDAAYAGDYAIGFTPAAAASTDDQGLRTVSLSASASFSVPTALGTEASQRVEQAAVRLVDAERAVRTAGDEALVRLYGLYQETWLAQEELELLDAELAAARLAREIADARFNEGTITLTQLGTTEEALERAQTALDQGTLAHRLAWLELAFAVGLDPAGEQVLEPELDFSGEPPKPPELSEWAVADDPQIATQLELIAALSAELSAETPRVSFSTTKLQVSVLDHSLSVSYAFANPSVSATYSSPSVNLYSSPSTGAGASTSTGALVSVGLSGTLSFGGTGQRALERSALELTIEREEYRLDGLYDALDYRIRATYQQMHRAIDAVAQVERTVDSARANLAIVQARTEVGQAGQIDLTNARIGVERATYNLTAARIARETATMQVALAASYFSEHYPHFADGEGASK